MGALPSIRLKQNAQRGISNTISFASVAAHIESHQMPTVIDKEVAEFIPSCDVVKGHWLFNRLLGLLNI